MIAFIPLSFVILLQFGCSQYSEPQGQSISKPAVGFPEVNQKQTVGVSTVEVNFEWIKTQILEKKCLGCHNPDGDKEAREILFDSESALFAASSAAGSLIVPGQPQLSVFYQSLIPYDSIRKNVKLMPPGTSKHGPLTGDEILAVAAWISAMPKIPAVANLEPISGVDPSVMPQCPTMPAEPDKPTCTPITGLDYSFIREQILEKKCIACHKAEGKAEDLIFGTREETVSLMNDQKELFVVPGKAASSLMYLSLQKDQALRNGARIMPPRKAIATGLVEDITPLEVELIKKWIEEGAR